MRHRQPLPSDKTNRFFMLTSSGHTHHEDTPSERVTTPQRQRQSLYYPLRLHQEGGSATTERVQTSPSPNEQQMMLGDGAARAASASASASSHLIDLIPPPHLSSVINYSRLPLIRKCVGRERSGQDFIDTF